jgi:hypothetical protein
MSATKKSPVSLFLGAFLLLLGMIAVPQSGHAQWMQRDHKELFIGMSVGSGGLYRWGGGSFDVHYRTTTLRIAPGLWYMGVGLNQQIGHLSPKRRSDRLLMMNVNYLNDWFLSSVSASEYKRGQHMYQFMPGVRVNLNHLGTIYFEADAGLNYLHERRIYPNGTKSVSDHFSPMVEARLGGIFLMRRYRVQQFPPAPKKKVLPIKKRKLEFKK